MEALLLRVHEAANLLSISRSSLYRLINKGEIQALYVGDRSIRIKRSDIEAYIAEQELIQK